MTIPENATPEQWYEFEYPYVLPQNDVVHLLSPETIASLTPLEAVFIMWMMECGNPELAVNRLIHPAHPFDIVNYGAKALIARATVGDTLRQLKKSCPFLKLYNLDYIAGIIHGEVSFLRRDHREARFYGPAADINRFTGKKSIHEEEMAEIAELRSYLELLVKMNEASKNVDPSNPESRRENSRIDRVLAEAQQSILKREKEFAGKVRDDSPQSS